jgi:hypothetical protein
MHLRSSLNFWLLFAATLAVDGVAISWVYATTLDRAGNLYLGLICSQISALCIGCFFSPTRGWWRLISPVAVTLAVAILTACMRSDSNDDYHTVFLYLSLWLPQVVILLAVLWLLRQTAYAEPWSELGGERKWQFSVAHLLVIMTTVAILSAILRFATDLRFIWFIVAVWIANNVLLAAAALIVFATRWHRILQFAAVVGSSLVLAFGIEAVSPGDPNALSVNIIQAIVLSAWLAIGEIVPIRPGFDNDSRPALTIK